MKLLITALLLSLPSLALAQQNCAPTEVVRNSLTERYGEGQSGIGMAPQGRAVSIWHNPETRSWTILVHHPNGMTCMVASGQNWEQYEPTIVPEGEPS